MGFEGSGLSSKVRGFGLNTQDCIGFRGLGVVGFRGLRV